MKPNVGGIDKWLRIAAGIALLSLLWLMEGDARWWGLIGLIPIVTAMLNFCPAYTLLGMNTCPMRQAPGKQQD